MKEHPTKYSQDIIRVVYRRITYQILLFSHFLLNNFMWHGKSVSSVDIKCTSYFLTIDKSCQMAVYVLGFLRLQYVLKRMNQIINKVIFSLKRNIFETNFITIGRGALTLQRRKITIKWFQMCARLMWNKFLGDRCVEDIF